MQEPKYGRGKEYNDYGQGFYLTEDPDLACEWAVNDGLDGFVSRYEIEMDDLSILCLNSEEYSILHWLALLVDNRKFRISTRQSQQRQDNNVQCPYRHERESR